MEAQTNVDVLRQAKVLDTDPPAPLSSDEEKRINGLSAPEIAALIAIRKKVGDFHFASGSGRIRPWIL